MVIAQNYRQRDSDPCGKGLENNSVVARKDSHSLSSKEI